MIHLRIIILQFSWYIIWLVSMNEHGCLVDIHIVRFHHAIQIIIIYSMPFDLTDCHRASFLLSLIPLQLFINIIVFFFCVWNCMNMWAFNFYSGNLGWWFWISTVAAGWRHGGGHKSNWNIWVNCCFIFPPLDMPYRPIGCTTGDSPPPPIISGIDNTTPRDLTHHTCWHRPSLSVILSANSCK